MPEDSTRKKTAELLRHLKKTPQVANNFGAEHHLSHLRTLFLPISRASYGILTALSQGVYTENLLLKTV